MKVRELMEGKFPRVSVKLSKKTHLGDVYIATAYSVDNDKTEIGTFQYIVHRQGGLYFERQLSGNTSIPVKAIDYVSGEVSKEIDEPIAKSH